MLFHRSGGGRGLGQSCWLVEHSLQVEGPLASGTVPVQAAWPSFPPNSLPAPELAHLCAQALGILLCLCWLLPNMPSPPFCQCRSCLHSSGTGAGTATMSSRYIPNDFAYNGRVALALVPSLAAACLIGGRPVITTLTLGCMVTYLMDAMQFREGAFTCSWLTWVSGRTCDTAGGLGPLHEHGHGMLGCMHVALRAGPAADQSPPKPQELIPH